ncbi:MAG: hypothetical protein ACREA5_01985 [Nitrosotalea sp.]
MVSVFDVTTLDVESITIFVLDAIVGLVLLDVTIAEFVLLDTTIVELTLLDTTVLELFESGVIEKAY